MTNSIKKMALQAADPNLLLLPKINEYLLAHGGQKFTQEAMERVWQELTKPGRNRARSFSASSAGTCLRRQEFTYLGYPQKGHMPSQQIIFDIGTWTHAQIQAMLLSANLIDDIEVPLEWPKMHAMGSMDAQGHVWWEPANPAWKDQDFICEFKTVGAHQWEKKIELGRPSDDHLAQIHRYFLVSGVRLCSYILIDKGGQGNQGLVEFVVECDDDLLEASKQELEDLNEARENEKLHDLLPGCKIGTGRTYAYCPFRGKDGVCKTTTEWKEYEG